MTTDQLLAILAERGLRVEIQADGPKLVGPSERMTPTLRRVLKHHRAEIVSRLAPVKEAAVEYLWSNGATMKLPLAWKAPVGAWWFREEGATQWQPVPGTGGERREPPATE